MLKNEAPPRRCRGVLLERNTEAALLFIRTLKGAVSWPRMYKIILSFAFLTLCNIAFAQEGFIYDPKGKRNPFIPLVTQDGRLLKLDKEEAKGDLIIEGIIYDKQGRSFAIVNGSVAGVGDAVGDYRVLKVEENKVIFIKEGQALEVGLKKEEE